MTSGSPDPAPLGDSNFQAFWAWSHEQPLLRFFISEVLGGLASLSVYMFFLLVSRIAEVVTDWIALTNQAPAAFLDAVFAWSAAISGSVTFTMITLCELIRLAKHLLRRIDA
jgi:hypothetical protein